MPYTSRERRFMGGDVREESGILLGRAVVYRSWSEVLHDTFREQIAPGAFDKSLESGEDVYCSIDHDEARMLGRVSAGTLRLIKDDEGIRVEVPTPPYSYARDLVVAIKRRDLRGMSFIFDVQEDTWETRDGTPHRTVKRADLYEVSFVFFPAYPDTEAATRAKRAMERAMAAQAWDLRAAKQRMIEAELEVTR